MTSTNSYNRALVVIPARLESTRLPRKVLADICGWPMIRHVYERCKRSSLASGVLVATDSVEIATNVQSWGGEAIMTSSDCTCGTERIASIADRLDSDIVVNVQGDEPLIEPELIDRLIQAASETKADLVIPVRRIESLEVLTSPTVVKAVLDPQGMVMFFSRNAVPFIRDIPPEQWLERNDYWVVVGTASFRTKALSEYLTWPESRLESLEKIEQFRFLESGKQILAIETELDSIAVDVPEDLDRARRLVSEIIGTTDH